MKAKVLLTCLLLSTTAVHAEVLNTTNDDSAATDTSVATPKRGTSQSGVTARFGEPKQRVAAVGQPPITRWVYDSFTVYFEGDKVIHAVVNHPE